MEIQLVETTPVPATAVQWDGSIEQAVEIIKWYNDLQSNHNNLNSSIQNTRYPDTTHIRSEILSGGEVVHQIHFYKEGFVLSPEEWVVFKTHPVETDYTEFLRFNNYYFEKLYRKQEKNHD